MKPQGIKFVAIIAVTYALAYLVAGGIAYQLITKQFYVGSEAVFTAYLRNEADMMQWGHVNMWLMPGLILRALLVGVVLLPFMNVLQSYSFKKRAVVLAAIVFVLMHLAAAAPSPSNVEGFVYMKSEIFSAKAFLLTQPEMILQSAGFGIAASWAIGRFVRKSRVSHFHQRIRAASASWMPGFMTSQSCWYSVVWSISLLWCFRIQVSNESPIWFLCTRPRLA